MSTKIQILLLFTSMSFCSKAQVSTTPFNKDLEPRKCYVLLQETSQEEDDVQYFEERYFKITPPVWENVIDTLHGQVGTSIRTPIQDKNHFIYLRINNSEFGHLGTSLCLCKSEAPSRYQTISFTKNDSIQFIKRKHLVRDSKIIQITKEEFPEIQLDDGKCYGSLTQGHALRFLKLEAGNWSGIREIFHRHGNSNSVRLVQEALLKVGYDIPTDNIMGEETKAAIKDFQTKQNIPVGKLDKETLRLLGLM